MKCGNLILRCCTGLVYVGIVAACVIAGGSWLVMLCVVLGLAAQLEWLRMARVHVADSYSLPAMAVTAFDLIAGASASCLAWQLVGGPEAYFSGYYNHIIYVSIASSLAVGIIYIVGRAAMQIWMPAENAIHSLGASFTAQAWIALPLSTLVVISALAGNMYLLALFIFIWLNDTGAYLTGVTFGRHRLFERISPKKSWEGFVGGTLTAVAGAFIMRGCFPEAFGSLGYITVAVMALVVVLAATAGDLVESLLKRTVGVKDSGAILPGHGGMLDRIDSLLLAAPATLLFLMIVL